eukprot:Nk52_evm18s207 gene=Nk52_evmTU18s207
MRIARARGSTAAVVTVVAYLCGCVLSGAASSSVGYFDVWPEPLHMEVDTSAYMGLDVEFVFVRNQEAAKSGVLARGCARYQRIIKYAQKESMADPVASTGGQGLKAPQGVVKQVYVNVKSANEEFSALNTDESYRLTIHGGEKKGQEPIVEIDAPTVYGALRGIETFSQLAEYVQVVNEKEDDKNGEEGGVLSHVLSFTGGLFQQVKEPSMFKGYVMPFRVAINDAPRFPYRGVMIDTSRHFLPLATILTNLDAMSFAKMNIMHWHMVDDTAFSVSTKSQPDIGAKGAYSPRHVYSEDEIGKVLQYAKDRGIEVVVEVDLPGHSSSWSKGAPWSTVECLPQTPGYFIINPVSDKAFEAVTDVFGDVVALKEKHQPGSSNLIHVGGDEVRQDCWEHNDEVKRFMAEQLHTKDFSDVNRYFESRMLQMLFEKHNSKTVVWQEVYLNKMIHKDVHDKYGKSIIVDFWTGDWRRMLKDALGQESDISALISGCWYLDHLNENFDNYYACDPRDFEAKSEDELKRALGGHSSMWAEHCDANNFMSRVWERSLAVAEKLWSKPLVDGSFIKKSFDVSMGMPDIKRRVRRQSCVMVNRGIRVSPQDPSFCPHEYEEPVIPWQNRSEL